MILEPEISAVFHPEVFDITQFLVNKGFRKDDNLKLQILQHKLVPSENFVYPSINVNGKKLKFQVQWVKEFPWLAYSKKECGVFCKICVLFNNYEKTGKGSYQNGSLITSPFQKWKNAKEKFEKHANTSYHKHSFSSAQDFQRVVRKNDIIEQIDQTVKIEKAKNRAFLKPIIETLIFCGEQELPMRGDFDSGPVTLKKPNHRDGKFRALLRFRANSGDKILREHLETCRKNAMYTSPDIQNEIIEICGGIIRETLVSRIKNAKYFSILADETTDITAVEQMSICARYVHKESDGHFFIREDFLCFVGVYDQKSENLASVILNAAENILNLDMNQCVGQGYDGAANMAGHISGVCTRISNKYPKVRYIHCASHRLNLAISNGISAPVVKNALLMVEEISKLFRKNVHASQLLSETIKLYAPHEKKKRLLSVCQTRFIERHDSIFFFVEIFECIAISLEEISQDSARKISCKATSYLAGIEKSEFIVSLLVCEKLLSHTLPLSIILQDKSIDLIKAIDGVQKVVSHLKRVREEAHEHFNKIFNKAVKLASDIFKADISKPRTIGRQGNRANPEVQNAEDYYRIVCYLPCLDSLIQHLESKFIENSSVLTAFQVLLPKFADPEKEEVLINLSEYYSEFCADIEIQAEYSLWCEEVKNIDKDADIIEVLENCDQNLFPSIHALLQILATLPVTTCTPERSLSTMRRLKTIQRNRTGNEKLSSLAALSVHWDVFIDPENVLDIMAIKDRRLLI